MDNNILCIALCQTNIVWEDKDKNIDIAEGLITKCRDNGADIALFAEMSFTGFSMDISKTAETYRETIGRISEIARDNDIAIGFGWVESNGDKAANCYSIVSDKGEELVTYKKIHSFRYGGECDQFVSGNKTCTIVYKGVRITPFICYDLRFPELFRTKMSDTDVYIIPANWPERRSEHWKTLLRARAIENQAYVLGINCVGDIGGLNYSGDSCVIEPDGTVCDMISGSQGIIYAFIDKDKLGIRETFPIGDDRKDDLYIEMYRGLSQL